MPLQAIRNRLTTAHPENAENPALLLACFLLEHDDHKHKDRPDQRINLLTQAQAAGERTREVYAPAFKRWRELLPPGTLTTEISTSGRFITGLGSASALETGIRLHNTYGVPLIPGSGLKGLAAHYAHSVWGETDAAFKQDGPHHTVIFGTTQLQGGLVFHDAWLLPESLSSTLVRDVMTPHHSDYNINGAAPPSDFDSPIPIPFLSIRGKFLLAITPSAEDPGGHWTGLALSLLKEALKRWGAGGKTRAGYGRFESIRALA